MPTQRPSLCHLPTVTILFTAYCISVFSRAKTGNKIFSILWKVWPAWARPGKLYSLDNELLIERWSITMQQPINLFIFVCLFCFHSNRRNRKKNVSQRDSYPDDDHRDHHLGYFAEHGLFKDDVRNPQSLATGEFVRRPVDIQKNLFLFLFFHLLFFEKELLDRRPSALVSALEIASAKHIAIYIAQSQRVCSIFYLHDWPFCSRGRQTIWKDCHHLSNNNCIISTDYWMRHHRTGWQLFRFLLQPIAVDKPSGNCAEPIT